MSPGDARAGGDAGARDARTLFDGLDGEGPAYDLLGAARMLVDRPGEGTAGLWPRAAVLLARQALEVALKTYWSWAALGMEGCTARAQLLCLGRFMGDPGLAGRAYDAWTSLSRASHHHAYDLPPTQDELHGWFATVGEVIERTERAWR